MTRAPAVSVVMPAWNAALTVAASLRSVLAQSFGDFELIVVDDGSSDATPQVLRGFCDARLRVLRFANAGPSISRNRGIQAAAGEFVACIDADDLWEPRKLERQRAALQEDQRAGVAYGWADFVDADGRFVCPDSRPTLEGEVYEALLCQNFISSGSNSMIRRPLLARVGGFDPALRAIEDWELHVRLARHAAFVCVPEVVVRYRQRADSLSSELGVMEQAFRLASQKVFAEAPPSLQRLKGRCSASFYHYLAVRATQSGSSPRRWLRAARLAGLALRHSPLQTLRLAARGSPRAALQLALRSQGR